MIAFIREVSPLLDRRQLTHRPPRSIKIERARKQHAAYEQVLKGLGLEVESVPALSDRPDGVFVENMAVLLPEVAVIARPDVLSRLREVETVATLLAQYRPVQKIIGPGQLDGGDVLRIGRTLYVAQTARTNAEGIADLRVIIEPFGYQVRTVEIRDCRNLKTACTFVPPGYLVANPAWVDLEQFGDREIITVDTAEPFAANTLTLAGTTLVGAFPKTEIKLKKAGLMTRRVDISELAKVEGGLTCLSLILEPRALQGGAAASTHLHEIRTPSAPAPDGHYAQAVIHGEVVYVSGQLPIDPVTSQVAKGGIEGQTEQVLHNVAAILMASGSSLARVLRVTLYLGDSRSLPRIESIYTRRFGGHRPARIVLPAGPFPKGCLLAMDVLAAADS